MKRRTKTSKNPILMSRAASRVVAALRFVMGYVPTGCVASTFVNK